MMNKAETGRSLIILAAAPAAANTASNGPQSYLIGGIIAFIILGYLIYTLVRPEKF